MYHYDPNTALEELTEDATLPNPVHVRDMMLRKHLSADKSLELNRLFVEYQKFFGEATMHRWSELFIPTLREAPADAEVASHKFLGAGRLRSPAGGRNLLLSVSRQPILQQDHGHRPRGDGQDRPGVLSCPRCIRAKSGRPADAGPDGRKSVSPQRPQGRRPLLWA
jgi:hypothetical protein